MFFVRWYLGSRFMNTVNRPADIRWWIWSFPMSRDFDWSSSLWSSLYNISSFILFWQTKIILKKSLRWAGEFQGCPDLSSIRPIDMHAFSRNCKNIIVIMIIMIIRIIMTSKNLFLDKMAFTVHKDSYFGQKTKLNKQLLLPSFKVYYSSTRAEQCYLTSQKYQG